MNRRALLLGLALLAALVFLPPVLEPRATEARCIDELGRDRACAPDFAHVVHPDRTRLAPRALFDDLAYAVAAAGPVGCACLLAALALAVGLLGVWCHGFRCGARRMLVVLALGLPVCIGLAYASCFLDGREIRLGAEAGEFVPASLHTQTTHSTGLLTPRQLVRWHYRRGFRVLNVSDKDDIAGALEAFREVRDAHYEPPLLLLVGEEWHGHPDLVLVNVKRAWDPQALDMATTVAGVQRDGGAAFIAHPWAKLSVSLETVFEQGVDGAEVVNGIIHGGETVLQAARLARKSLLGVTDYKFGPHVNALTLVPRALARTPAGVVRALEKRRLRVVYAVPGGPLTDAVWGAATLGTSGAAAALHVLFEVPRGRRSVWFVTLAGIAALWWLATRPRPERARRLSPRVARLLFLFCVAVEFTLPAGLGWQVRAALGPVPVPLLIALGALFAVPLLAATHELSAPPEPPA